MCRFASGFIHPRTLEVKVYDLDSHSNTEEHLDLIDGDTPDGWRAMHYLPSGEVECRCLKQDAHSGKEYRASVLSRWPRFVDFFVWAMAQPGVLVPWSLSLNGLTSAKGLVIPKGVKFLYLNGLTSAKGLVIPKGVELLSLNGLTSAKGLVIPKGVKLLLLNGLTSDERKKIGV